jgi:crotonobetainyl-CoA:carnitine CoA-transferase CaiB-like acyl-CoA transferase
MTTYTGNCWVSLPKRSSGWRQMESSEAAFDSAGECIGPLSGFRVLEVGGEAGEYCGRLLGELGADVIKVEPPEGAATRSIGPFFNDTPERDKSLYFWHYNTNKRSVTLRVDTTEGRALLDKLFERSDCAVVAGAPGLIESNGLAYERLDQLHPRLTVTYITPFGLAGPYRDFNTTGAVHLALGGITNLCGYDDVPNSPPITPQSYQAWHIAGVWAACATVTALFAREVIGTGQMIDMAVHDACATCTEVAVPTYAYTGRNVKRQTGRHAAVTPTPPVQFATADGRHVRVSVANLGPDSWLRLVDWLRSEGAEEDLGDDRYLDMDVVNKEMRHVLAVIGRFIGARRGSDVFHSAQARGLPWSIINYPEDLAEDPHLLARGFFVSVPHPELSTEFSYPGAPYEFSETPWAIRHRAPLLGEHNVEVYEGEIGLTRAQLVALKKAGRI